MVIENVSILMPDGVFRKGAVEFDRFIRKVAACEPPGGGACPDDTHAANAHTMDAAAPPEGPYLIPGLIDIHTHGVAGYSFSDATIESMYKMAAFYARNGVTSFLATTLTAPESELAQAMKNAVSFIMEPDGARCADEQDESTRVAKARCTNASCVHARCVGINMEGPFFSYGKRGAQPADKLMLPDLSMLRRLRDISGDNIKLVCIAPELEGAMEFIRETSQFSHVSLAHSEACYATASEAFACGASHVTHLFNGMNPFAHREPGIIGAAMDANAFVEVICDGHHLHPAVIRAIFRMFPGRVCLISDSLECTGLPDGSYMSAGLPVILKDGKAMLADGSTLAGSSITLMQAVRLAVSFGIPLVDAVNAATKHPAQAIGMEGVTGSIISGAFADFVLLDNDLNINKVYISGEEVS